MLIIKEKLPRTYRYKAWQEFTKKGKLARTEGINVDIAASWQRCLENDLDPKGQNTSSILTAQEIDSLLTKNSLLIKASQSNLKILERSLERIPHAILLSDSEGNILYQSGTGSVFDYFQMAGLVLGGNCSEKVIGTTAPGITLIEKKPTFVLHEEHYSEIYHWCCCVASPVFDHEGHLIGCLDVTTLYNQANYVNFLFGLNAATVNSIQADFRIFELLGEIEDTREILKSTADLTKHGLLVINENGKILHANQISNELLTIPNQRLIGNDCRQIIGSDVITSYITSKKMTQGKVTFTRDIGKEKRLSLQVRPLYSKTGRFIGKMIILEEEKKQPVIIPNTNDLPYSTVCNIIGEDPKIKNAIRLIQKFAPTEAPIFLEGETGTGKDLFSQAIHKLSDRREGPFIPVNCAAIPHDLFESELFGYSEGAFTGALRGGRKGKFEIAEGGTLFLDELNYLPVDLQAKLLRAVEGGGFFPLGATMPKSFSARIIGATSVKIEEEIQQGRFLKELFYRLSSARIFLPPLRERLGDLEQLVRFFLEESAIKFQTKVPSIPPEVMQQLYSYDWPGNIRQLKCCIEFMVCVADGEEILLEHLPYYIINKASKEDTPTSNIKKNMQLLDKWHILRAIESTQGRVGKAAQNLDISRSTIYRKRKQYGLVKPHQK